ncbi:MAG: primosomal protein N' [Negativicutes bacterium]|nr:primosomal protein N' [Negativicutes bacterium]
MEYVRVKLDRVVAALESGLTYSVPPELSAKLRVGSLVEVPLQGGRCRGIVVAEDKALPDVQMRAISQLLDQNGPTLNEEQLQLIDWLAGRYLCSWAAAFQAVLPAIAKAKVSRSFDFHPEIAENEAEESLSETLQEALVWCDQAQQPIAEDKITAVFGKKMVRQLREAGFLTDLDQIKLNSALEYRQLVVIRREDQPGRGKIRLLWQRFLQNQQPVSLREVKTWPEYSGLFLKKLLQLQFLTWQEPTADTPPPSALTLTGQQQQALQMVLKAMKQRNPLPILIHGVTSSGKTEVYLQAIAKTLEDGKSAIMLVPEISLTAQMINRFRERFGERVMIWHSGLSGGERAQIWQRLRKGETCVVLGARSAVFAPAEKIGLIILDEEHEQTYKQEEDPKYHAREVAILRARYHHAAVVFGSATPAVTSFYLAEKKQYHLVEMQDRIGDARLPRIIPVDMRSELKNGNRSIFSEALKQRITQTLAQNQQVILFHNRRGFHRMSLCRACGYVLECPHCEVPLIQHHEGTTQRLRCHLCGYEQNMPPSCPHCGSAYFRFFGLGTEKVVEECEKTFPGVPIYRMDRDSTRKRGSHAAIVSSFEKAKAAILVGTQMVAKGFDFPLVTCVGILSADNLIRGSDGLAGEHAFSLLLQVSGRAGRGEFPGEVFLQSYSPEHPIIQAVCKHDYKSFYRDEIEQRKKHHLPPFGHLATILVSGEDGTAAETWLKSLVSQFEQTIEVLGPTRARVFCIQKRYRFQIVVEAPTRPVLVESVKAVLQKNPLPASMQLSLTLDPMRL